MFENLEEFKEKVFPKIEMFQGSIESFRDQIFQMESIIQRFDEVLLTKASKIGFETMKDELSNYILYSKL